ncbi:MAG: energy transducer TonB [Bacteroidota bacterium]
MKTLIRIIPFFVFVLSLQAQSSQIVVASLSPTHIEVPTEATTPIAPLAMYLVDQQPQFPETHGTIQTWLPNEVDYPSVAQDYGVEGQVVVRCIVGTNGQLTDFKVVKALGFGCDEAAIDALSNMPAWSPARKNGQLVPVVCYIPVDFSLR